MNGRALGSSARSMPFLDHLIELRSCLIKAMCGIALGSVICLAFADALFAFLTTPFLDNFAKGALIGTGPTDAFVAKLKVSLFAALILTSPYSFLQLWIFVSPGLHQKERKLVVPFVIASTLFFLLGVCFCYGVALPFAFQFFEGQYMDLAISPQIRIGEYFEFILKTMLVFGLVFEMPVISFFLAHFGLLTAKWLISNLRISIVVIFFVAALLTPPDVVSQLLLAFPLLFLYALCILVCYWAEPTAP